LLREVPGDSDHGTPNALRGEGGASGWGSSDRMPTDSIRSKTDSVELLPAGRLGAAETRSASAHYDHTLSSGTTSATLKLRASPTTPARDDVHEHDQGDDDHRRDGDDGDGGHGEDHDRRPFPKLACETPKRATGTARALALLLHEQEVAAQSQ
jgi:hypothetical protein